MSARAKTARIGGKTGEGARARLGCESPNARKAHTMQHRPQAIRVMRAAVAITRSRGKPRGRSRDKPTRARALCDVALPH
eukprot:4980629-Lingulodinium_polyedra.AAC.1